ncbi:MAG: hypothetical protein AB8B63_07835, partial [Granulosicoccus sp.]
MIPGKAHWFAAFALAIALQFALLVLFFREDTVDLAVAKGQDGLAYSVAIAGKPDIGEPEPEP